MLLFHSVHTQTPNTLPALVTNSPFAFSVLCSGMLWTQKSGPPCWKTRVIKVVSFKPGVNQNIALHALPTGINSTVQISTFLVLHVIFFYFFFFFFFFFFLVFVWKSYVHFLTESNAANAISCEDLHNKIGCRVPCWQASEVVVKT